MQNVITNHVSNILAKKKARKAFDKRLDEFAREKSITLDPNKRQNYAEVAEGYVRAVALLLAEFEARAAAMGIQRLTAPIIQTAIGYFLSPADSIPDKKGLYGLLDDAYLACRFVARISELVQAQIGYPLLDTSLDQHSPTIRILIGEPIATQLDQYIEMSLNNVLAQIQLEQMQAIDFGGRQRRWNDLVQRENVINTEAEIMAIASGSW